MNPRLRYKNRLGLPLPIVEAVINDPYSKGDSDYTATSLIAPPRMRRLVEMYPDETVEDVADVLYRLQGQAVHTILERAADRLEAEGYVVEKRFTATFTHAGRIFRVSAQVDIFDSAKADLNDYKNTSVYALSKGLKDEHLWQVNLQAYLLHKHGFQVRTAGIIGIFRDWSAERADNDPSYPQEPVGRVSVPLMLPQEVEAWVVQRIALQEAARAASSQSELAPCTDAEVWAREDTFAAVKDGASRASKVCSTEEEAAAYVSERPAQGLKVERRYGKAVRCARYCPAASVCEQWKSSPRNPSSSLKGSLANGSQGQGTQKREKPGLWVVPDDLEVRRR